MNPFTWTCQNCGEVLEEQFDACWKCGTLRFEETPPSDFEDTVRRSHPSNSLANQLNFFRCPNCGHEKATTEMLRLPSLDKTFIEETWSTSSTFNAIICVRCGYAQFYKSLDEIPEGDES